MEFRFADFRFLTDSLVLYRGDELIPLKRNQAVLLRYFLLAPEKIHSKDMIMDSVWQGKVVSEQVVFQTISQLRAVFGDTAIQTFSKKGYKWQLPIVEQALVDEGAGSASVIDGESQDTLSDESSTDSTSNSQEVNTKPWKPYVLSALVFVMLSSLLLILNEQSEPPESSLSIFVGNVEEATAPETFNVTNELIGALSKDNLFNIQRFNFNGLFRQYFSYPKHIWNKAKLNNQDWLIAGEVLSSHQGAFFHYVITNEYRTWRGYVFSEQVEFLPERVISRLHQLHALGILSTSSSSLELPKLLTIHQQETNDAEITLALAKHYIKANQVDVALVYLDQLAQRNSHYAIRPYIAMANYQIGKIYKHSGRYVLAQHHFDLMEEIILDLPLVNLRLDMVIANAWLAYAQGNSSKMFTVLESGLAIAEQTLNPLDLFELHILYSILADKTGNHDKKYDHLNEAQALLLKHRLDESNLAIVYYHFALFVQNNVKATPYLQKILSLPRTTSNYWVQDQAFEILVQSYIEDNNYALAHSLFDDVITSPMKMLLKAKIYLAQQQEELALPLLSQAFELARLEHDVFTGLRSALALYRLSIDTPNLKEKYWAYLEENAEEKWLLQQNVITAND